MSITIFIPAENLTEQSKPLFEQDTPPTLIIDYADNNIVGLINNGDVEVFSFKDYLIMDNRFNNYELTYRRGFREGIYLTITSTRSSYE
jgi:hypothetical protein